MDSNWKLFQRVALYHSGRIVMKNTNRNPDTGQISNYTELKKNENITTTEKCLYCKSSPNTEVIVSVSNNVNIKVEAVSGNISAYGYAPEEFTSGEVGIQDIIYEEDVREVMIRIVEHLKNKSEYFTYDCRILDKNGMLVWIANTVIPTYNCDGKAIHSFIKFENINRNKDNEQLPKDTNENLFDTLKTIGEAVILIDVDGRIDRMNPAAEKMIGLSNAKARYKPLNKVIRFSSQENSATTIDLVKIISKEYSPIQLDEIFMRDRMDGAQKHVSCNISPVYVGEDTPKLTGYILVIKDLTDLYKLWMTTQKNQNTIRSIFEHSVDGIVLIGADGIIRECSRGYEQITGLSGEQVVGRLLWDVVDSLVPPEQYTAEDYEELHVELKSQVSDKRWGTVTRKIVNQMSGEQKTLQVVYFPVNLDKEISIGAICRDVTKELHSQELLRQSEQKLRESNELLESIMEAVPAPLYVKNKKSKYIQCNDLFPKMVNLTKKQIIGKTADEIFPDAAKQINEFDQKQLIETVDTVNHTGIISVYAPEIESIIYRNFLMHNGRKEGIVGVIIDVSELKRTERQLTVERNRLQALGDHFPNGCLFRLEIDNRTDQGIFTYLSNTCEQLTGLKVADILQNINLVFEKLYPDDLQLIMQSGNKLDEQNNFSARIRYRHPNGNLLWLRISAHRHDEGGFRVFDGFIIDITDKKLAEIELERYRNELELLVKERTEELEAANEELHTSNEELHQYRDHLEQMVEQKTREVITGQERLVSLSNHLTGGVIFQVMGREPRTLRFSYLSAHFAELFGISIDDVVSQSKLFYKCIHPDDLLRFRRHYIKAHTEGDPGIEFRIRNRQGDIKWIHMRASHHIVDDGIYVWDGFMLDITSQKLAEQELENSSSRQNLLYKVLQTFQSTEDIPDAIRLAMAEMGKYTGIDRIYIAEKDLNNTYEWCNTGIAPLKERFQNLQAVYDRFDEGKYIQTSDLAELSPDLLQFLEDAGILCALCFPLTTDGVNYGYVCFDNCTTIREWDNNEIELLSGLSQIFANAIRRLQAETSIRLSQQTLRTVMDNIKSNVLAMDFDTHKVLFANQNVKDEMGSDIEDKMCWEVLRIGKKSQCDYCPRLYLLDPDKCPNGRYEWEYLNNRTGKWYKCNDAAIEWVDGRTVHLQHSSDITHRKMAELELMHAKEKAEEADRLKSAFLANISHEIRTPLNGITGFLQFLTSGDITSEFRQEYIQVVNTCSQQLVQIIEDVIDIAKVEANQLNIFPVVTDINQIMHDLQVLFEAELKNQNKDTVVLLLDDTGFIHHGNIYVDPVRLRQILFHIINNAIKFTQKGYIRFGYKLQPSGMLEFEVEDTGIGIPENMHDVVFERFRQVEQGNNRFYGGTGIGLSISQSLVQLMGGRIWLQSAVGIGSTFNFTIPYLPITPDDTWYFNGTNDLKTVSYKPFADKTVLLAEPAVLKYQYYEKLLITAGINVVGAKDLQQWLDHISRCNNIHVIIASAAIIDDTNNNLVREINSVHTEVPLIFLGNIHDDRHYSLGEGRNKIIVEEPVNYVQLMEAMGKAI